jgi:formylglycine-generating enzyme required for sulfatase activity
VADRSGAALAARRGNGDGSRSSRREFGSGCATIPASDRTTGSRRRADHLEAAQDWEKYVEMSDANSRRARRLVPSGRQTQPRWWNDPAYNDPAQPVVGICWHEARAYCAWLSAQTGQCWRLPSEAEWEAAARGQAGRRYAWGDDFDPNRCNTFESHVRGTTPVGVFPGGDTPEGLVDLSGNVWEWTSSAYHALPLFTRCTARSRTRGPACKRRLRSGACTCAATGSWVCAWCVSLPACRPPENPTGEGFRP